MALNGVFEWFLVFHLQILRSANPAGFWFGEKKPGWEEIKQISVLGRGLPQRAGRVKRGEETQLKTAFFRRSQKMHSTS